MKEGDDITVTPTGLDEVMVDSPYFKRPIKATKDEVDTHCYHEHT